MELICFKQGLWFRRSKRRETKGRQASLTLGERVWVVGAKLTDGKSETGEGRWTRTRLMEHSVALEAMKPEW